MANKKILVASLILFTMFNAATIDSKAMSITDSQATSTVIIKDNNSERQAKIESNCPDLDLSEEELLQKYKDMGYDKIHEIYQNEGYSDDDFHSVMVNHPILKNVYSLSNDEIDLLYHVVFAEVGNQDYETIKFTTSVIINRIYSDQFPNTLEEVVMQENQFEAVSNGAYQEKNPDQKTIDAVNDVLQNGVNTEENVLFFRSDEYHAKYEQAFQSGKMYFSFG